MAFCVSTVFVYFMGVSLTGLPAFTLDPLDGEPCSRPTVAGVDRPWVSRRGSDIQINANRLYLMRADEYSVTCCGRVVEWRYQASVRARVRPLTLMVWRRIGSHPEASTLKLIGQSSHWYMKDKSRSIEIRLSSDDDHADKNSILVRGGDFLGWHTPNGDVISYSQSQPSTYPATVVWELNTTSIPIGWQLELSQGKTLNRIYGVQAIVEQVKAPEFLHPPKRLSVKCPLPAASHVTAVRARSLGHETVTFGVYGYNPWLTVNRTSGEVFTLVSIRGNTSHEVTVIAQSACGSRSYLTFAVQCIDIGTRGRDEECRERKRVNSAPIILAPSHVTMPENKAGGSLVFSLYARDDDEIDNVTVSILCASESCHLFDIDNVEGTVSLKANESLDFEAVTEYIFHATAFDGHVTSLPVSISVSVTNVNEAPHATQAKLTIHSVAKEKGSVVANNVQRLFSDPDGDDLEFNLSLNGSSTIFVVDVEHFKFGAIILSKDFKVQKEDSPAIFILELFASDGALTGKMKVELQMFHVNSRPRLLNLPSNVTMREDEFVVSSVVFTVLAKDEDVDDDIQLFWSARSRRRGEPLFSVNRTNGDVTLLYIPAMSTGQESLTEITVTAFDGLYTSDAAELTITIVGTNDKPRFLRKVFQVVINESQVGTPLFGLNTDIVKDADPDEVLTLSVLETERSSISTNTFVSNGLIGVKQDYDIDVQENPSTLTIDIQVTDSGGLTDEAALEIFIQDDNDNAPVVENDKESFNVSQPVYPGMRIGQVKAYDLDQGLNGKLSFQAIGSSLNDTSQYFAISGRFGWLISTGLTPPEEWNSLYIAVSDHGSPPLITMATINIITRLDGASRQPSDNGTHPDGKDDIDDNDDDDDEVFSQHLNSMSNKFRNKLGSNGIVKVMGADSESKPQRKTAILVLITICVALFAVAVTLGYQLWKAKKLLRINGTHSSAHHEYRFPWIPRQITMEDEQVTNDASGVPMGNSVINPNFSYRAATHSQLHESPPFSIPSNPHKRGDNRDITLEDQRCQQNHFNDRTLEPIPLHNTEGGDDYYNACSRNRRCVGTNNTNWNDEAKSLYNPFDSLPSVQSESCDDNNEGFETNGHDITSIRKDEEYTVF